MDDHVASEVQYEEINSKATIGRRSRGTCRLLHYIDNYIRSAGMDQGKTADGGSSYLIRIYVCTHLMSREHEREQKCKDERDTRADRKYKYLGTWSRA